MTMAAYQRSPLSGHGGRHWHGYEGNKLVGTRAIEIIRIDKDDHAELIVGAKKASDPIEGAPTHGVSQGAELGAGFGNPFNVYAWNMNVYKNCLYVGTFDIECVCLWDTRKESRASFVCSCPYYASDCISISCRHRGCHH